MLIQSINLFEECEHEHIKCTSNKEQHFHENDSDDCCSHLNFQFEVFTSDIASDFTTLTSHLYTNQYNEKPQIIDGFYHTSLTDRGPPLA